MKPFEALLLVSMFVLPSLPAAEPNPDKVIDIEESDVEMAAAIQKARASLPHFWSTMQNPKRGETGFSLKIRVADSRGAEHFWLNPIYRENGKISGVINNDPNIVGSVRLGQRVEVAPSQITDWLYLRDDKMVGNHTLRVLFKKMPKEEVDALKSRMADP